LAGALQDERLRPSHMQLVLVMAWLQNCRWPWQSKQSLLSQPLLSSSTGALSSKS
jgi:hypothetical protein